MSTMRAQPDPNINPNPNSQNADTDRAKSVMFLTATLIDFLAQAIPDSRHMNPNRIRNTKPATVNTHT